MREIGGYIQIEERSGKMLYEDGVKLNSGRNALAYLLEAKNIKKIMMPKLMCDSCDAVIKKYNVEKRMYNINYQFKPIDVELQENEWLYIVNYYGQLSDDCIKKMKQKYKRVILDYSQSYFQKPIMGIDTIYSCRKYFGVPDGAILYTDCRIDRELEIDVSYDRMLPILGRFEENAETFYEQFKKGESNFDSYPLKEMSKLTKNLLRSIDYTNIKDIRMKNYLFLAQNLKSYNKLKISSTTGLFMYPLYVENGEILRKELQNNKIYTPCLWPNVVSNYGDNTIEGKMSRNIVPLPIDQRYNLDDMDYIVHKIKEIYKTEFLK